MAGLTHRGFSIGHDLGNTGKGLLSQTVFFRDFFR